MKSELLRGDCLDVLAKMPEASIDACVTDPPYELGFMGKHWDASGIANRPETWAAVLRVLKPGSHLLACGGTRTYHRMASAVEDAGFEIRDCLAWLYGQGFPKSLNLGEGLGTALKPAHEPIVLARKPFKGSVKANVQRFSTGALNIDACRIETSDEWKAVTHQPNDSIGTFKCKERITQQHDLGRWPANVCLDDLAAMVLDEQSGECPSAGEYKNPMPTKGRTRIIAPTFSEGWKQYNGGYWAEIVTPDETFPIRPDGSLCEPIRHKRGPDGQRVIDYGNRANRTNAYPNDTGGASRFFYVAKPSREERDMGLRGMRLRRTTETVNRNPDSAGVQNPRAGAGRGAGAPIYGCAKCGLNLQGGRAVTPCSDGGEHERVVTGHGEGVRNFHPTVKPVELMRWLVRLVTPINGTVLDPFTGSGTTGMACRYEQRNFIGIEREQEYIEIAERRIAAVCPLFSA